jgi:hypothetical protein
VPDVLTAKAETLPEPELATNAKLAVGPAIADLFPVPPPHAFASNSADISATSGSGLLTFLGMGGTASDFMMLLLNLASFDFGMRDR